MKRKISPIYCKKGIAFIFERNTYNSVPYLNSIIIVDGIPFIDNILSKYKFPNHFIPKNLH